MLCKYILAKLIWKIHFSFKHVLFQFLLQMGFSLNGYLKTYWNAICESRTELPTDAQTSKHLDISARLLLAETFLP